MNSQDDSDTVKINEETKRLSLLTMHLNGQDYIDFSTLLEFTSGGQKRSTIARKLKKLCDLIEVPYIVYKNRHYYEVKFALQIHKHFYEHKL